MNNENLKKLAIYYVEPMLYVDFIKHHFEYKPVNITVIGATINKNEKMDGLNNIKCRDIMVRVNAIYSNNYNHSGYPFGEIIWEGKLQDWYQACADAVNRASGYNVIESEE